jgi:hypothetical protein
MISLTNPLLMYVEGLISKNSTSAYSHWVSFCSFHLKPMVSVVGPKKRCDKVHKRFIKYSHDFQIQDAIIFSAVKDYSNRDEAVDWNLVSRSLPGRSAGSAKLRWSRNLRGLRQTATRQPSDDEEDAAELMLLLKTAKYSPTPSGEENPSSQVRKHTILVPIGGKCSSI